MREAAFEMMKFAKQKGCVVIVSSSDSTDHYEQYLQEGADFILLGEAEQSLADLVTTIEQEQNDFISIPGLAYIQNDAVIKTARRSVLKELDNLPFPAWDLIEIEDYKKAWSKSKGYFSNK